MSDRLADQLAAAVREDSGIAGVSIRGTYRAAGGGDDKVMPPTFPDGPYLIEPRWVDGEQRKSVVLDQVPSQANRIEEALGEARDKGRLQLPLFELTVKTSRGPVRLTSLDFPHRYADAYLRDSMIAGIRFDKTGFGQRLREASVDDVRPLYEREPVSLLFGAWDSHRKGRWPKFARCYTSSVIGIDPLEGVRRGGRMDPVNLTGAVDSKDKAEGDWAYIPEGQKAKGQKLSEIGHGNIAPNAVHGGVAIKEARRQAWLTFAGLARLRFGDAPDEAADLGRATLAALAIAGDRLAFGRPSMWLRSGCDLTRTSETLAFERDGGELEPLGFTAAEAIEAFHTLRDRAAEKGLPMATDTVSLEPMPSLAHAVEFAVAQSATED